MLLQEEWDLTDAAAGHCSRTRPGCRCGIRLIRKGECPAPIGHRHAQASEVSDAGARSAPKGALGFRLRSTRIAVGSILLVSRRCSQSTPSVCAHRPRSAFPTDDPSSSIGRAPNRARRHSSRSDTTRPAALADVRTAPCGDWRRAPTDGPSCGRICRRGHKKGHTLIESFDSVRREKP